VGEDPDLTLYHNVPHNVKKIGVFMNEGNHKILNLSIRNGLDMIQLHGNESPVSCLQLKLAGLSVIKAFNIDQKFNFDNLRPFMPVCDYFLFDAKSEKPVLKIWVKLNPLRTAASLLWILTAASRLLRVLKTQKQ
jgi:phosphoribosylanthranilate isomerase